MSELAINVILVFGLIFAAMVVSDGLADWIAYLLWREQRAGGG